jgi:hypothetical protein
MEQTPPSAEDVTTSTSPTPRRSAPARRVTRRGRIALAAIVVIVGAALVMSRRTTGPGASSPANGQAEQVEQVAGFGPASAPAAASAITAAPVARERSKNAAATKTKKNRMAGSPKSEPRIAASAPLVQAHSGADSATVTAVPETPTAGPVLASVSAVNAGPAPVTITGCLEVRVDDDEFRLSETEGADAPKSRSWRTGFLKKRSAPVALVELLDPQALHQQVGKRVAATGLLTSRELKVSSLRVVAPSCD